MAEKHRRTLGNIFLFEVDSNPDATLTAPRGSLALDSVLGVMYQNTNGATAWSERDVPWEEDEFTATGGQTVFALSRAPTDANSFTLTVGPLTYDDTTDYTVAGTVLTWLDTDYALKAGDKLLARYV